MHLGTNGGAGSVRQSCWKVGIPPTRIAAARYASGGSDQQSRYDIRVAIRSRKCQPIPGRGVASRTLRQDQWTKRLYRRPKVLWVLNCVALSAIPCDFHTAPTPSRDGRVGRFLVRLTLGRSATVRPGGSRGRVGSHQAALQSLRESHVTVTTNHLD